MFFRPLPHKGDSSGPFPQTQSTSPMRGGRGLLLAASACASVSLGVSLVHPQRMVMASTSGEVANKSREDNSLQDKAWKLFLIDCIAGGVGEAVQVRDFFCYIPAIPAHSPLSSGPWDL